jgi:hypothetical protein
MALLAAGLAGEALVGRRRKGAELTDEDGNDVEA